MMKVYQYDICDGDMGIIFAKTHEKAMEIFRYNYPDADPECYDYTEIDKDKYSYGASVDYIGDYDGTERLMFIVG